MRVTILGAGGSAGTPAIGEDWGRCNPHNPRNRRSRPAVLVEHGGGRILLDTPPDLRQQLLTAGVASLSGVLYTHAHADHLHGIAFQQDHGFSKSLGFRIGDIAYSTDLVALPEAAFSLLRGIRLWIIGTLTERPHPAHCHVDKALQWIDRVAPEQAILTHLGNEIDYDALAARLPRSVRPAFDGLVRDDANGFAASDAETDPGDIRLLA